MILVLLEHNKGEVGKAASQLVSASQSAASCFSDSEICGLVLGSDGTEEAASKVAELGLSKVYHFSSPELENYRAETYAPLVASVFKDLNADVLLAGSSSLGKDLMPRVGRILEAGQASDVIEFLEGGRLKRPMYAGNIIAEVEVLSPKKLITIRTSCFDKCADSGTKGELVALSDQTIGEAEVVVSGGRALKSEENFGKYIEPLADALGAAIGASRAAVDSGYAPNDWQVGQTGKVVAPDLYVAVGISGAIQHLAGMKDSKVIVAINKDPEAPIFEVADYGLVADLYEVITPLAEQISKAKGAA